MQIYIAILGLLISLLHPYNPADTKDQTLHEPTSSLKAVALAQALPEQQLSEQAHMEPQAVTAPQNTPQNTPQTTSAPSATISGCGDNEYARYIYSHESGCNTSAVNSIGCYGIGQACPASKIAYCGADYTCQNEFFTQYANSAYGGWAGAYQHWLNFAWW